MSRPKKIALLIATSLAGLILTLFVAAIVVIQTPWFHNFIRARIVSLVDEATGGTASIGSLDLSWTHLRARIHDFVLRGLEPATAPPLFQAKLIQVDLGLLSPFKSFVDLAALLVDTPQANIIVFPNGRTNIPAPINKSATNKSALETVIDLKIGKFDLRNGSITLADQKANFSADGGNLRAQLAWQPATAAYIGEIDMNPLNWRPDHGPPIPANVRMPLTLQRDTISVANARLATAQSQIVVSGSLEHLDAPVYRVHASGRLALHELQRAAELRMPLNTAAGPPFLNVDLAGSGQADRVQIETMHLNLGQSNLAGSGMLKGGAGLEFRASLALGQLARLFRISGQPEGTLQIGGGASLGRNNPYLVRANMSGHNLSLRRGATRLSGISVDSALTAAPRRIELSGLRVGVLGSLLTGTASLTNLTQLRFSGNLRDLNVARVARAFAANLRRRSVPYSGILSGPVAANGNIKARADFEARANLAITPVTGQGIPLAGRLNVNYSARTDTVTLRQSYLALPHSQMDLTGSLGRQIQVRMITRDFGDFRPLAAIPITFHGGDAVLNATVTGTLSSPRITGGLAITNFAVQGRSFSRFAADLNAARTGVTVNNASLSRDALRAQFTASVGLRNWKPEPGQPLRVDLTTSNGDLADVLALARETRVSAGGTLTAEAHIAGTLGDPRGNIDLKVSNGNVDGNPFQTLTARVAFTPGAIQLPSLDWVAAPARIGANGTYQHALNDLTRGSLRVHISSTQVELADILPLVKDRPGLRGTVSATGDVAADITPSIFQVRNLNANLSARDLQLEGHHLGDFTATASTAGNAIQYNLASDFAGSKIRAAGQTLLTGDHHTTASASIANLPIPEALALAGRHDLPISGSLTANANFSGTLKNPRLSGSLVVTKGSAYQQPFDRLQATLTYTDQLLEIPTFYVSAGPAELTFSTSFAHPPGDFHSGQMRFNMRSNSFPLDRLHAFEQYKPGLAGTLQLTAAGAATLRRSQPPLLFSLNADLRASGLSLNRKPLGDILFTASTRGQQLTLNLNSNFALTNIYGTGRLTLAGDYPLTSQIRFSNITYAGLTAWTGGVPLPAVAASADGQITITGPVARPDNLRGELQLTKMEAHSLLQPSGSPPRSNFEIHNQGPVRLALNRSQIAVQDAHFTGTATDLTLSGTAELSGTRPLNLHLAANTKLDALQAFNPDILSSGSVRLNADMTGTLGKPAIAGRLELQNASFNMLSLPNGISNAYGSVAFNGTEAAIQTLTGEIGGGKVSVTGFMAYGPPQMQFRLQATANRVRLAYPQNVTTQVNARLTLAGTSIRSILSGTVSVLSFVLHENTDIGALLSQAAAPPAAPPVSTGPLAGINLDVRIVTAPDVQFRSSITQNLEATADLTLRGTIDHPGMFGRISIIQGDVVFFGARYTITQGSIEFFNPNQINPTIRIDLETMTQGVTVTLTVSGPMDRLKLSYHSDPPLRFDEIVALLATGRTPTTDPVLAAYAPAATPTGIQQQGLSALLGQGLANPVTSHLQRLFGVTRLSVNPMVTGISSTPQTTLTVVQQITPSITFTYVQDVSSSNPLTIQMEWSLNPRWSVIAQRDIYGELNLNFLYKRRFH